MLSKKPFAWFKTDVNGRPVEFVHFAYDAEVLQQIGYILTPVYTAVEETDDGEDQCHAA
jgi:hypothetical protein